MVPTTLAVDFVVSQTKNSVCNEMLIMQFDASVLSLSREVKCYMIPFFCFDFVGCIFLCFIYTENPT